MSLSRRSFLRLGAATTALTLSGCRIASQRSNGSAPIIENSQREAPLDPEIDTSPSTDPYVWRLLNRAAFGPRAGEYHTVIEQGGANWLEAQLRPDEIPDQAVNLMMARFALYHSDLPTMASFDPDDGFKELIWSTLSRQIYSKRQLYEIMVDFWSDHFAIFPRKDRRLIYLKIWDDREVIRPHAMGKFRDLLAASVHSPAMLHYLDNTRNFAGHPNENYARELLELHTLGVDGGYKQADVAQMAGLLSGLTVYQRGRQAGSVYLNEDQHDNEDKVILETKYRGATGDAAIEEMIDDLSRHPATAEHIATKLVRRFVADDLPQSLVEEVTARFLETDGDIKSLLRHILNSPQFVDGPSKYKRPLNFMVSALRAFEIDVRPSRNLYQALVKMGQVPFMWPAPDGYPDRAEAWVSNQLPRWNFAHDLVAGNIRGAQIDFRTLQDRLGSEPISTLIFDLWGRPMRAQDESMFQRLIGSTPFNAVGEPQLRAALALILAAPQFQLI